MKNLLTEQIEVFNKADFKKTSSSVLKHSSNLDIKLPSNIQI